MLFGKRTTRTAPDVDGFGDVLVGIGLIVGAQTAVAAFFGSPMCVSFMLSGAARTDPVLFPLSLGIILAWRAAGLRGRLNEKAVSRQPLEIGSERSIIAIRPDCKVRAVRCYAARGRRM